MNPESQIRLRLDALRLELREVERSLLKTKTPDLLQRLLELKQEIERGEVLLKAVQG